MQVTIYCYTQLYMDIAPTGTDSKLNVVEFSFTKINK